MIGEERECKTNKEDFINAINNCLIPLYGVGAVNASPTPHYTHCVAAKYGRIFVDVYILVITAINDLMVKKLSELATKYGYKLTAINFYLRRLRFKKRRDC